MQDRNRRVVELVLVDLEQLVARIGLEDLDKRLVVVASGGEAAPFDDALALAPNDRDLPRRHAVRVMGVEAEEPHLAHHRAMLVEALHPDVVEVRGPVHGRT